jgi:hypothetical protein
MLCRNGHQPVQPTASLMPRPKLSHSKAGREIEHRAYDRAADLAKEYAEHWEAQARTGKDVAAPGDWTAKLKAGHWRIIEKEIRGLAKEPTT